MALRSGLGRLAEGGAFKRTPADNPRTMRLVEDTCRMAAA